MYTRPEKILFDKIFEYKKERRFAQGLKILKILEKKYGNVKVVIVLIATIYFERKKYSSSAKYFRKATFLNPHAGLSSLGLFHSFLAWTIKNV